MAASSGELTLLTSDYRYCPAALLCRLIKYDEQEAVEFLN
jgi:hypothetical protein